MWPLKIYLRTCLAANLFMNRDERRNKVKFYMELYDASTIGFRVVFSVLIGGGIGWWLDKKFHSSYHWLLFIFLFFGIVAAFKAMFYEAKREGGNNNKDKKA